MKVKLNFDLLKKSYKEKPKLNVETVNGDEEIVEDKKRRRKKAVKDGEVLEPHENKKWKRKGSKLTISEFFKNIFLNKKKIKYNYYVLLTFMLILSVLSVYKTGKTVKENNTENYESISAFNLQGGSKLDLNKSVSSIFEERNKSEEVEKNDGSDASINSIKEEVKNTINNLQNVDEENEFEKPLKKYEIQKIYSTDSVIYSKTLDMWKIHTGIDLKADIDANVYSVKSGVVSKIYDDSFLGKTIVIKHDNGYKSVYSNLNEKINVKVGENIKKGQKIGTIGSTAIGEIKDDPHLHFAMYKDDEYIDPSFIIYE